MTQAEIITELFNEHRQAIATAFAELEYNAITLPDETWQHIEGLLDGCKGEEAFKTELKLAACRIAIIHYLAGYIKTMVMQSANVAEASNLLKQ